MRYSFVPAAIIIAAVFAAVGAADPNSPGILEPALSATNGSEVRIPHTDQASGGSLLNVVGPITHTDAQSGTSLMGYAITSVESPNVDMRQALSDMKNAAEANDANALGTAAQELADILLGNTQGRIYDGFAMLNFNRGAFVPDQVPGEYKMKTLRNTGLTEIGIDGQPRTIWEIDVALLYYDGQIDSDCFLMRVPVDAHEFDPVRVNYKIYSLVTEDFSPTVVMMDHRLPGSVQFPLKGFDTVWEQIGGSEITEMSVMLPPNRLLRGVYTWGWRVHPPRIQFLQPVWEHVNAHTGQVELEPQGMSYAFRNAQLTIDGIGDAAPEKKMYVVADAVLNGGASPATIAAWLSDANQGPSGTWNDWANLASDQRQLPEEAWDVLAQEGISQGEFGPYRMVSAYMNGEMYGDGPDGSSIQSWNQGDAFQVKLINLDNYTHYFRNVDFGTRLHDDISDCCGSGSHSFEIMNFKPTYGAPKVAEVQWRAGWGFRPHFDVMQQQDVFFRPEDQVLLKPFTDGSGESWFGWQYSAANRGGDFRFNPPPFIIESVESPALFPLREDDGSDGLLIGQTTEGFGVAKMCDASEFPLGGFCARDLGPYNPNGALNRDTDGDGVNDQLWFPPFLRNPNAAAGGDIIPPTPAWKPFLWINPNNGTLFIDPTDPSQGYWADLTYAHGAPISAGSAMTATIEAPRAGAQVFYQFDDLYHDNAIFSPHPKGQVATNVAAPDPTILDERNSGVKNGAVFPNPFRDRATIRYMVKTPGPVTITTYAVSGREVMRRTLSHRVAGEHEYALDGRELAAGVYFVRISDGNGAQSTARVRLIR